MMKKSFANLFIITGFLLCIACRQNANETTPIRKDIIQAVYASGKISPLNHYTVISRSAGYIKSIKVKSGEMIHSGAVLLEIKNEQNELSIESLINQVSLAKQNADPNGPVLNAIRQELESQHSKYTLDSLSYARTNALFAENACSQQQLDLSKTQTEISKRNYQRTRENYQAALEKSKVEFQNACNQLDALKSNRDDYKILAAISGKVYDIYPKSGDLVSQQTPLMEIGDSSLFEVELSIDETDIGLISINQKVFYNIDAYPDTVFSGIVTEIIPHVQSTSKSSKIKATIISISGKPFYSGMSAEANIISREKANCLVIPREFLHNGNEVKIKGEKDFRTIRKGIEDLQFIEVISGLTEKDILIKE